MSKVWIAPAVLGGALATATTLAAFDHNSAVNREVRTHDDKQVSNGHALEGIGSVLLPIAGGIMGMASIVGMSRHSISPKLGAWLLGAGGGLAAGGLVGWVAAPSMLRTTGEQKQDAANDAAAKRKAESDARAAAAEKLAEDTQLAGQLIDRYDKDGDGRITLANPTGSILTSETEFYVRETTSDTILPGATHWTQHKSIADLAYKADQNGDRNGIATKGEIARELGHYQYPAGVEAANVEFDNNLFGEVVMP
jgi:hypothetical protein